MSPRSKRSVPSRKWIEPASTDSGLIFSQIARARRRSFSASVFRPCCATAAARPRRHQALFGPPGVSVSLIARARFQSSSASSLPVARQRHPAEAEQAIPDPAAAGIQLFEEGDLPPEQALGGVVITALKGDLAEIVQRYRHCAALRLKFFEDFPGAQERGFGPRQVTAGSRGCYRNPRGSGRSRLPRV